MGAEVQQKPVKLVTSIIYRDESSLEEAERELKRLYGEFGLVKEIGVFDYTDYYCEEMGSPLKRKLISFNKLVGQDNIAEIKRATNKIENRLSVDGKRVVNIDPGYITEAKLVLLTTKDYTHRVYVGGNIFAESTLFYKDGKFMSWPWTYPDYASEEMISYFEKVRMAYMEDRNKL